MTPGYRDGAAALTMVQHLALQLQWLLSGSGAAVPEQRLLLPPRTPIGAMLTLFIQAAFTSDSPTDFSVILFVANHNVTVDAFDKDLLSDNSPYHFLRYRCVSPYSSFFYNDTCSFKSTVQTFDEELKERTDVSKAKLVVIFIDITWFEGQLFVINEIYVRNKMIDDDTKYLLILSAVPTEDETRKIFIHLNYCGLDALTQAVVWNSTAGHFQTHNLRCETPMETILTPYSMYNPFHQRSLSSNYLLFLKDDESQLLKEILHKKLPTGFVRTCISHGETWDERQMPIFFEKNSGHFGQQLGAKFLYPHFQNDFCFLVRRARQLTFMESLWLLFPPTAWVLVGATTVGVTVTYVAVVSTQRGAADGRLLLLASAALETVRCLVTGAFSDWAGRFVYVPLLLSVASLILSNGFCGDLASIFAVPVHAREIDTLEDVASETDLLYYNVQEFDVGFFSWKSIYNIRAVSIEDQTFIDDLVRSERKAALLRQSEIQRIILNPRYAKGGHSLLRQVPQCLFTPAYQSVELSQPTSFIPMLNSLVVRAVQAGLWVKIEKEALDKYFSRLGTTTLRATRSQFAEIIEALSMKKLGGLFVTLLFLLMAWTFLFLMEILWYYVIQQRFWKESLKRSNCCHEFYKRFCCFGRKQKRILN